MDIPISALEELIDEFALNAKFFMSSDLDTQTTAKVNAAVRDLLKNRFRFLPLHLVSEAYTRGSLGELGGTTRFTLRNIYTWLSNIEEKNQRLFQMDQSRKDSEQRKAEEYAFRASQKRNTLYGAAFHWKISQCPMPDMTYDLLTLDKIVEAMDQGYDLRTLSPDDII